MTQGPVEALQAEYDAIGYHEACSGCKPAIVAKKALDLCRSLQQQLAEQTRTSDIALQAAIKTGLSYAEDAARYRWLRDGCRNVRSAEAMERILANWMEWTPLEGDMAIDAERP